LRRSNSTTANTSLRKCCVCARKLRPTREHTAAFVNALEHLEALAAAIADGGEAYSVGVRETARALAPDLEGARLNVASIMGRAA
jgi:hypothetical protein